MKLAQKAKAIAALVVVGAGEAITYGVLPESWRPWAQIVVVVGAYAGVYRTRNAPASPAPPAG
jgi:hypothetical protein